MRFTFHSSTLRDSTLIALAATAFIVACSGRPTVVGDAGIAVGGGSSIGGTAQGGSQGNTGGLANDGSTGTAPGIDWAKVVHQGAATVTRTPRSDYGALVAGNTGERSYVVESRRDVEPGPYGLPWRSRFRLAAYDDHELAWVFPAEVDDLIGDVAIHPSGDVTLSLERQAPESGAYQLVRLNSGGQVIGITTMIEPTTVPPGDRAQDDPQPLFRMKSDLADATTAGWVRLLADGEGLTIAWLSFVGTLESNNKAIGLGSYVWQDNAYRERWARVVEGPHSAQPAAWAYDEFRWREQAVRPFLARDDSSGDLLVARAWNSSRCAANRRVFGEFTQEQCVLGSVGTVENERLPLAVTRFDKTGARHGSIVIAPEADAAEQVAFALAASQGQLAVVGSIVRTLPDGSKRTYPDSNGYVDYDGFIAIYDSSGTRLTGHDFNFGRGDLLAAMRWTHGGIVAVGSVGWDRWQGGMSISRGADPCVAWLSNDGAVNASHTTTLSDGSRHFSLHEVMLVDHDVVGLGFSDAPMTHSGDGNNTAARTFGSLQIRLSGT